MPIQTWALSQPFTVPEPFAYEYRRRTPYHIKRRIPAAAIVP